MGSSSHAHSQRRVSNGIVEVLHVDHDCVCDNLESGAVSVTTTLGEDWDIV